MKSRAVQTEKSDSPNSRTGQRRRTENPLSLRVDEALAGKTRKWLADQIGMSDSTLGDKLARGKISSEDAIAIARVLGRSLDWLLLGGSDARTPVIGGGLVLATDADWIELPEYDLREISDEGLGSPASLTPIRRDWLYGTFRASSDLWLTRLISDYPPAQLSEGDLVVCRPITRAQLAEGHLCLWRVAGRVVAGTFSTVPDALLAASRAGGDDRMPAGGAFAAYLDPSLPGTTNALVVPPSRVENDGPYHPIARILGVMLRPI